MTLAKSLYNIAFRAKTFLDHKQGRISDFEYRLRKKYLRAKHPHSVAEFYQSYPPLHIDGLRPTHTRYTVYGLSNYLTKKKTVLDVGGNTGFFSSYLSRFVKHITVVEQHRGTIHVGAMLARHEKIKNISFINADFSEFTPTQHYDIIMSLSVHAHIPMRTATYIKKLHGLLKPGGILVFESHIKEWDRHPKRMHTVEKSKLFTILESGFIDDNNGRMRKFLIMKKN